MRILVAEDDERLAALLAESLADSGWTAEVVHNGREAHDRLLADPHVSVALLDWMLPGMDGAEVTRSLRRLGVAVPILMLTARGEVTDRIEGLDAGADDYLTKPFDLDELSARLRALVRRSSLGTSGPLRVGDLVLDRAARRVSKAGQEITLSAREFDILVLLVTHAGEVVTRYDILDQVWDGDTDLKSNVIDVHLASIRAKVDKPFASNSIVTLRGVGYRMDLGDPDSPEQPIQPVGS